VVELAEEANLISQKHFSVDGMLLQAAASAKSFKSIQKPASKPENDDDATGNPSVNFRGQCRKAERMLNTAPQSRLCQQPAKAWSETFSRRLASALL
jgi:hypothetical protein